MLGLRERMEENGSAPGTGEAKRSAAAPADPEVVDRPLRRRFSQSYKLRIVEEADRCTEPGEVGQVLRREGLYSSHLTTWRKAAHSGSLKALSKKRGRKPERNPLDEKVRKLERRNARLENELRKAHLIIDVQGKVAGLLGQLCWIRSPAKAELSRSATIHPTILDPSARSGPGAGRQTSEPRAPTTLCGACTSAARGVGEESVPGARAATHDPAPGEESGE